MTKSDIVKRITEKTGIDKQQVIGTVELLMKVIKNSLIMGENVYLRGFGTFRIKHRAEKKARNILKIPLLWFRLIAFLCLSRR